LQLLLGLVDYDNSNNSFAEYFADLSKNAAPEQSKVVFTAICKHVDYACSRLIQGAGYVDTYNHQEVLVLFWKLITISEQNKCSFMQNVYETEDILDLFIPMSKILWFGRQSPTETGLG